MKRIIGIYALLLAPFAFGGSFTNQSIVGGLTAGSASTGCIKYNGTTQAAGQSDSGAVAPVHTNLLNYDGDFAATILQGGGGSFRALVSQATYSGLYPAGIATGTNYSIMSNGTLTYVNGGGNTYLAVGGTPIVTVSATGASVSGTLSSTGPAALSNGYTVTTLNAIQSPVQGQHAWVTDALAPTFLGVLTGGGAVVTPVFFNGTSWVSD